MSRKREILYVIIVFIILQIPRLFGWHYYDSSISPLSFADIASILIFIFVRDDIKKEKDLESLKVFTEPGLVLSLCVLVFLMPVLFVDIIDLQVSILIFVDAPLAYISTAVFGTILPRFLYKRGYLKEKWKVKIDDDPPILFKSYDIK